MTLEFSVTRMLDDFGKARNDVYVCGGERYCPSTCCNSIGSAKRSLKRKLIT